MFDRRQWQFCKFLCDAIDYFVYYPFDSMNDLFKSAKSTFVNTCLNLKKLPSSSYNEHYNLIIFISFEYIQ